VLCNEHGYKPHEVDALTPFQVNRLALPKKGKKGAIIFDRFEESEDEMGIEDAEYWTKHKWRLIGISGYALEVISKADLKESQDLQSALKEKQQDGTEDTE